MNAKTKSTLLFVLLMIMLIVCSTLVLTISIKKGESNISYADTSYNLWIGDIQVTSTNLTIDSSDTTDITSGSAVYNPENSTLTLTNFSYTGKGRGSTWYSGGCIHCTEKDLTIVLVGNNSITKKDDPQSYVYHSWGIYQGNQASASTLTIEGEGTLEISFDEDNRAGDNADSGGIYCEYGTFIMNSGTVVSEGGLGKRSMGLDTYMGITFNGGTFTGIGHNTTSGLSRGIYAYYDYSTITINGGTVSGIAPLDNGTHGAYGVDNGSPVKINGGTLTAIGANCFKDNSKVSAGDKLRLVIVAGENEINAQNKSEIPSDAKYANITVQDCILQVGTELFPTLSDAYTVCQDGDTIVLLKDFDTKDLISDFEFNKALTLDLNGYNVLRSSGDNYIIPKSGHPLTIENSNVATGGIKDGISSESGSKIILKNCRLPDSKDEVLANSLYEIAVNYRIDNIKQDGSADENGYKSIASYSMPYDITVNALHGSVTAYVGETLVNSARQDYTVQLVVAPDYGYRLKSIGVSKAPDILYATNDHVEGMFFAADGACYIAGQEWTVHKKGNPTYEELLTISTKDFAIESGIKIKKVVFSGYGEQDYLPDYMTVDYGTITERGERGYSTIVVDDINNTSVTLGNIGEWNSYGWNCKSVQVYDYTEDLPLNFIAAENGGTFVMPNYAVIVEAEFEEIPHTHDFSYTAEDNTITAICRNADCYITEGLTLTLNAPTGSMIYDGNTREATISAGYNAEAFVSPTIEYYKDNVLVNAADVKAVGVYVAKVTYGDVTAQVSFEIEKANPTYTAPTAKTNLAYTGDEHELINAGTASNGEMQYKLGTSGTYSTTIPVAINAGTYIVYYRVVGDTNYNDIEETPIEVSIAKIDSTILEAPTAKIDLVYTGIEQALLSAGTAMGGEIQYKLGVNGAYRTAIPMAITAGNHIVYFKVVGDNNHNDTAEDYIEISIAKANPTYTVPTGIEAPYDVALSIVGLPDGFTWMDGTQQVNTWGENIFKAKFTPEDTQNYNKIENIDVKVNVKWILVDPTQKEVKVEIDDGETIYTINITVKVEVKTEISVEAKQTSYANLSKGFVAKDEDISAIYGVKLIRTTNGVEEEIQPSDIKEGQTIIISMAIPENLIGKPFRLLHIHSAEDISEVSTSDYSITADGKTIKMEANKLSEFVFVSKIESGDNGFVYEENTNHGFCVGWIVFIFVILELLATCLYVIIRYGFFKELVAKCKLDCLYDKLDLMTFIGLCVAGGIFLFAFIALCCHQCALTIIMFILALIICCAFAYFFLKDKGFIDKWIKQCKDYLDKKKVKDEPQPKVEEQKEAPKEEPQEEASSS